MTESVQYLADRIDKIETRLEKYIEENTRRLDTLIELTRHTSTIAERQSRVVDELSDVKARVAIMDTNSSQSFIRVHERIDTLASEMSKKEEAVKERNTEKFEQLRQTIIDTDNELKKWLNRGWGAWFIAVGAFSVIQFFAAETIDRHVEMISELKAKNQQITTRLADVENQMGTIVSSINSKSK